jgi:3'-phosphoadenosine 5'-phosphosulfate sulfotransferase (PAPS reductase)/FAD synthetase
MIDPFHITGPALISFSGGRTSAYMLWRVLQAHGGILPDDVHVTFANTGKERAETLRFVHECATRWNVRVRWLEWRTRRVKDEAGQPIPFADRFEEVGLNSASRDGTPFARLIAAKGYTPNAVTRFCTSELKVRVMKHFMQAQGYSHWTNVVGLRADEPRRVAKVYGHADEDGDPLPDLLGLVAKGPAKKRKREQWQTVLPLAMEGITERDVLAFWRGQPFDLGLRSYEGNCDGCFLKAWGKLCAIERDRPGTMDWWAEQEAVVRGQFVTEHSYRSIQETVRGQPALFDFAALDADREHDADCGAWDCVA